MLYYAVGIVLSSFQAMLLYFMLLYVVLCYSPAHATPFDLRFGDPRHGIHCARHETQ